MVDPTSSAPLVVSGVFVKLVVMDTAPLITLAAADGLDYLLYPNSPVYLPDAVFYEATINASALGAQPIAQWVQANGEAVGGLVHLIPTTAYADFIALKSINPAHRQRNLGETAALEAIRYGLAMAKDERALLVSEDSMVTPSRVMVLPADQERMIAITTRDFLMGLETAGRINSVDAVYQRATDVGRSASQREVMSALDEQARTAVQQLLSQTPPRVRPPIGKS
jgi:hypothetical protein